MTAYAENYTTQVVQMVPVKNELLFRSLLMIFIDWQKPGKKSNALEVLGYFLTVIRLKNKRSVLDSFTINFSGRKANEFIMELEVPHLVNQQIYVDIEDENCPLLDCLMLLKEYRKDGVFKMGRITTIQQRCSMEILISQTTRLLTYFEKHVSILEQSY